MLTVIDTQTCNIESVLNAFRRTGAELTATVDPSEIENARAIVLPGVGAFEPAMAAMRDKGLIEPVLRRVKKGTPFLGICLGMQMLADTSEEFGSHTGLGLVPGRVIRLTSSSRSYRVPNIGWYQCNTQTAGRLFPARGAESSFYFVHSFHFSCADAADVAATIDFDGKPVVAAVERGNIFGVQFHPEKSQDDGLQLLNRFNAYVQAHG